MERSNRHHSRDTNSCCLSLKAVVCRHFFICVLFVAIFYPSPINANYSHASSIPVVCHSEQCFRSEAVFNQNMNLSVNPCEDFYSYVCGHWADNYPPSRWKTNDWRNVQEIKIDRIIRDHLEAYISRSDPKPVAQAKDMYKACLKNLQAEENNEFKEEQDRYRFRVIEKYLKKFGLPTIPMLLEHKKEPKQNYQFDWISSVAKIQRTLGLSVMIGLSFALNERKDQIRLTLGGNKRPLSDEFPTYIWSSLQSKSFASKIRTEEADKSDSEANTKDDQQYEDSVIEDLKKSFDLLIALLNREFYIVNGNSSLLTLAEELRGFQNQLPGINDESEDEEPKYYTVAEIQNITDSHITPRKPYLVWQHYLDVLFADFPDNKPDADKKLQMKSTNIKHLCNLIDFVSKQSPELIELYIWKTVIEFFVDHDYNKLRSEQRCIGYVQQLMGLAVSYAIADRNFLKETKSRVEQMFNDIRSEFNQIVLEADWIDAYTKNASIEKSKATEARFGFPEWVLNADKLKEHYRDSKIDRFRHFENWVNAWQILVSKTLQLFYANLRDIVYVDPKDVIAYNLYKLNVIDFPGSTLQYPFYYLGLEALNYGALGYALGRELTHNFDDSGRHYDKLGKRKQMWSNHSLEMFDERASCLVEQYNRFYVQETKRYINGTLTLNDNIADNGGLREAFHAYRAYVKRNSPESLLPGFENFTHEQLFFISFGNQQCETFVPFDLEENLDDVDSPAKFRVLGVLSNMEEFSEAFQCPRGSKMNPEKKCRVW